MRRAEDAPRGRDGELCEFISTRASPLHQVASLLCGDGHLAHDLVQDTFVKAYKHWPRVRRADNPDAYVRRILLNDPAPMSGCDARAMAPPGRAGARRALRGEGGTRRARRERRDHPARTGPA